MKWTVYGGRERASFGSRILLVSCIFLLAALVFANFSKQFKIGHASAASSTQTLVRDESPLTIPKTISQPAASPDSNAELSQIITQWMQKQPGSQQWAASVRGFSGTSVSASYQADNEFESASIYKLYLTYALTKIVPSNTWSTTQVPGDGRSYADCVTAMMQRSDNACGAAIGQAIGWDQAQETSRTAGYTHTMLNGVPQTTTPNDTLQFLQDLYTSKTFSSDVRQQILSAMQHSIFRQGIVAGCPDCNVANKTGIMDGYDHDAAIIQVDGKDFGLVIFSKGGSTNQIADLTKLIQQYIRSH